MSSFALLVSPSANRVYARTASALTVAELGVLAETVLPGRLHDLGIEEIAGVDYVTFAGDLDESALQTPPDHPLDDRAKHAAIRAGEEPSPLAMNCSGKHAAMLLTCVVNGWDTADYRAPAA